MARKPTETPDVPDPLHWPPAFRRWLVQRYFEKFYKNVWKDPRVAWRKFLSSAMRDSVSRMPDGRVVTLKHAATENECYAAAMALFRASPKDPES